MPSGRGGGKAGVLRGRMSESLVEGALDLLKAERKILGFYFHDGGGKDFVVWIERRIKKKKKKVPLTIEVKSSYRGVAKYHRNRTEGETADVVLVSNEHDTLFTLTHKLKQQMGIS